jgi:Fe(3+) dicitrate transport protein
MKSSVLHPLSAFATINNLTNQKSIVANLPNGYRPNMPLSFIVGLKVDF